MVWDFKGQRGNWHRQKSKQVKKKKVCWTTQRQWDTKWSLISKRFPQPHLAHIHCRYLIIVFFWEQTLNSLGNLWGGRSVSLIHLRLHYFQHEINLHPKEPFGGGKFCSPTIQSTEFIQILSVMHILPFQNRLEIRGICGTFYRQIKI